MKTFILIIKMGISTLIEYIPLEIWKYICYYFFFSNSNDCLVQDETDFHIPQGTDGFRSKRKEY